MKHEIRRPCYPIFKTIVSDDPSYQIIAIHMNGRLSSWTDYGKQNCFHWRYIDHGELDAVLDAPEYDHIYELMRSVVYSKADLPYAVGIAFKNMMRRKSQPLINLIGELMRYKENPIVWTDEVLEWQDQTLVRMAIDITERRAYGEMGMFADALIDAQAEQRIINLVLRNNYWVIQSILCEFNL